MCIYSLQIFTHHYLIRCKGDIFLHLFSIMLLHRSMQTRSFLKHLYLLQRHHCVKSVRIQSFSGPYIPAFGLNTKIYSVNLRIQSKCRKIRTRKTSNTDAFLRSKVLPTVARTHFFKSQMSW